MIFFIPGDRMNCSDAIGVTYTVLDLRALISFIFALSVSVFIYVYTTKEGFTTATKGLLPCEELIVYLH